jgi:hypothetical protein
MSVPFLVPTLIAALVGGFVAFRCYGIATFMALIFLAALCDEIVCAIKSK